MYIIQMSKQMTIVMNSEKKVKSLEAFHKVRNSFVPIIWILAIKLHRGNKQAWFYLFLFLLLVVILHT